MDVDGIGRRLRHEWDAADGFLTPLRWGEFDPARAERFLSLISAAASASSSAVTPGATALGEHLVHLGQVGTGPGHQFELVGGLLDHHDARPLVPVKGSPVAPRAAGPVILPAPRPPVARVAAAAVGKPDT
ncbi:hypothetical protein [Micromonospora sp. IBHARD004]|uniref:hypothetical protein n=1 Tax=Micromonospora sp. IBHARD004 TaxID=3457764 RepID=UPI004058D190